MPKTKHVVPINEKAHLVADSTYASIVETASGNQLVGLDRATARKVVDALSAWLDSPILDSEV